MPLRVYDCLNLGDKIIQIINLLHLTYSLKCFYSFLSRGFFLFNTKSIFELLTRVIMNFWGVFFYFFFCTSWKIRNYFTGDNPKKRSAWLSLPFLMLWVHFNLKKSINILKKKKKNHQKRRKFPSSSSNSWCFLVNQIFNHNLRFFYLWPCLSSAETFLPSILLLFWFFSLMAHQKSYF